MSIRSGVPDAWDDDWESKADTAPPPEKKVSSKVTKAQRRAQQAEFNRQLWAEAESPQTLHFVEARSDVPLKQDIKPTVTLLSRRPQVATRYSGINSATAGMGQLGLEDDSDEEVIKPPNPPQKNVMQLRSRIERRSNASMKRLERDCLVLHLRLHQAIRPQELPLHLVSKAKGKERAKVVVGVITERNEIHPPLPEKPRIFTIPPSPRGQMVQLIYRDEIAKETGATLTSKFCNNQYAALEALMQVEGVVLDSATEVLERVKLTYWLTTRLL
ncbi:hypothetical protein N7495_003790 [Penicillium taxi]|uniref:uncharacterized protein n=1 Tax=Penicillium taxi TaxID=168475 RepID=UPI002545901A|nr:uncharacterized protein N7495_003790 [Penicillium taxi]KAJ5899046.1 hypothetical protein N7495_003790 [Penicillium taxi]